VASAQIRCLSIIETTTIINREGLAMMIELPDTLESAIKVQANALGVSPAVYVQEVLERDLASAFRFVR
jgi:hypothetical protein